MTKNKNVFATILLVISSLFISACENRQSVCNLTNAEGNVSIKVGNSENYTTAQKEQMLASGDAVKTGNESKATLEIISDKSLISLKSNTYLEITNFSEKELRQMTGIAIYKISPQNKELKIQTPQGTATVLGTILRIDSSESETTVAVEKGKVGFTKKDGTQIIIETGNRFSTSYTDSNAKPVDPFEMQGLFDENSTLKPILNPR